MWNHPSTSLTCILLCMVLFMVSGCDPALPGNLEADATALEHMDNAFELMEEGQNAEATAEFTAAIASTSEPDILATAYVMRGEIYRRTQENELALDDINRSIELDPSYALAYHARAKLNSDLEEWDKAIQDFGKAIDLNPSEMSYYERGNIYFSLEQWPSAIDDYSSAISLDPTEPLYYLDRGIAYRNMGDVVLAISDLETVLDIDPAYHLAEEIAAALDDLRSKVKSPSPLCLWFAKTQSLRANRVRGLTRFTDFYRLYGNEGLASQDPTIRDELVESFEEYLPYLEQFLKSWNELGSTEGGEDFWTKELNAEEARLEAIAKIINGAKTDDEALFLQGTLDLGEASSLGREAEAAMLEIHSQCLEQLE